MAVQLICFMLSFLGVMAGGPLLALLAVLLFKVDLGRLFSEHGLVCALAFGLYGVFVTFMFFVLQDVFIVFRPAPDVRPRTMRELVSRIEEAFSRPADGEKLFDVARRGDSLIVTWSSSIRFFQGTSLGGRGMKRVVVLSFDEKGRRASFVMKERNHAWSAALGAAEFSLGFSTGLFAERRTEAAPSLEYSPETGVRVDLKTATFDSDDLLLPIRAAVLDAGWSLHGGMAPGFWPRLLFALPIGVLFLTVGGFAIFMIADGSRTSGAEPRSFPAGSAEPRPAEDIENQLQAVLPSMKTEMIAAQISGIIRTPPEHLQENARRALAPYLNAYMRREGRNEALLAEALAFAERQDITGIVPPPPTD